MRGSETESDARKRERSEAEGRRVMSEGAREKFGRRRGGEREREGDKRGSRGSEGRSGRMGGQAAEGARRRRRQIRRHERGTERAQIQRRGQRSLSPPRLRLVSLPL